MEAQAANADVHNMFLRARPAGKPAPAFEQPDSQYVHDTVGSALVLALSEVASKRPADPVEYVAERLRNYEDTRRYCAGRDAEFEALRQARIQQREREARLKAIEEEMRLKQEQEEQRRREELERKRRTVPLETFALAGGEQRDKTGATPLHLAVAAGCDVETFLNLLHEGHSFCARNGQGQSVREVAAASKNDAVVKEIDTMIVNWIKEEKVEYLKWLLAAGYWPSFPSLKKAFGPKLKGIPDSSRQVLDGAPQSESRFRELWQLSAKGTKEHLEAHCRGVAEQHPEDLFARNADNLSAIHVALLCKNQDTAQYLAGAFPRVLAQEDGFGRLPIHYAHGAGPSFVEIVRAAGGADAEEAKDAFGFVPSVYARRFELLPEAPQFDSPELVVTETEEPEPAAATDAGDEAAKDEQDQSKLTPINEDEAEEN